MKSLRNIAAAAMLTFGAFGAMTYTSCNTDNCKNVVCQNGGTCNSTDGSCTCPSAYEGTNCQTLATAKFVKTWTGHWQNIADATKNGTYSAIISTSSTNNVTVNISNFFDAYFVHSVTATVSGTTITIPTQTPDGTSSVSGSGTYANGTISFTYSITNSGVTKNYSDIYN